MSYRKLAITGTANQITVTHAADPYVVALNANPQVSGISFDSGSNILSNYVQLGTFTPTAVGESVAGVTTYVTQIGYYTRHGFMCHFDLVVGWSLATGTGNLLIGSLPFAAKDLGSALIQACTCMTDSVTLNASYVRTVACCKQAAATMNVYQDATTLAAQVLAMPVSGTFYISGSYIITGA